MPTAIRIINDAIVPGAIHLSSCFSWSLTFPNNFKGPHSTRQPLKLYLIFHTFNADSFETGLTSRETQTRNAFFILAVGAPLVSAIFALFTTRRWWTSANLWSLPRLCVLWFISVAAFATIVFVQPGRATRSTFVLVSLFWYVNIGSIDQRVHSRPSFMGTISLRFSSEAVDNALSRMVEISIVHVFYT